MGLLQSTATHLSQQAIFRYESRYRTTWESVGAFSCVARTAAAAEGNKGRSP